MIWMLPIPNPKAHTRGLFNRMAASYAGVVLSQGRRQARRDVEWMDPQPHERVLDLACGPGTLTGELGRHARVVYGFDLAEQMIFQARRAVRLPNAHFAMADGESLPLPTESFDLVVCRYSFANFPAPQQVAREMQRVACPGGRIVVVEVVGPEDSARRSRWNRLEELRSGVPTRVPCLSDLLAIFSRANLQLVDAHVERRSQPLGHWLLLSACGADRRARRHLQAALLGAAKQHDLGVPLCRRGTGWVLYHAVARLWWRKKNS